MQEVIRGKRSQCRRLLMYGQHGIGKSTFGANAPRPLVLTLEDGLDDVGCDRTPLLKKTSEVARWLIDLGGDEEHPYKTVVLDTVDWLEKLIWQATVDDINKDAVKSIEDIGYGKGYILALKRWESLLNMLDCCRARGMNVILLSHAKVERFSPPDSDPYDRWSPDLHKAAAALVQEWVDEVLFATRQVSTITRESFGQTRTRAIGGGDRIVHTEGAATHAAKRRIAMPPIIPLVWEEYQKHWPVCTPQAGNISGIVTEGHSKQKEATNE